MCRRYSILLAAVFLLSSVISVLYIPAVHAGDYPVITELEPLMNSSSSSGQFVLENDTIVGRSYGHAVTWGSSGKVRDLGTFGGDSSGVEDVNAAGVIVGQAQDGSGQYLPAVWYPNGKMALVPRLLHRLLFGLGCQHLRRSGRDLPQRKRLPGLLLGRIGSCRHPRRPGHSRRLGQGYERSWNRGRGSSH